MPRRFLAPYPIFGTKNKRLPTGYQKRSPYYWWWQFLRRNQEYLECCERGGKGKHAQLYKDFGDVRDDDFHKWWTKDERGPNLFAEASRPIPQIQGQLPPTPGEIPNAQSATNPSGAAPQRPYKPQTTNPRGHARGGKVNTNIAKRETTSESDRIYNRTYNLQR